MADQYKEEDGESLWNLPAPDPVPDLNSYLRERRICLSRSSDRLKNYLQFHSADRRRLDIDYAPIRLDFENVSRCNFRCTMCAVSDWHKGQRAADMSLDDFYQILDSQPGLVEIKIQGLGEPTLQREPYFDMIRYARARHIWVRTTTNASLLHVNDNAKKLVDSDVNEIQISVDGADKAVFEAIRRGAVFERVVKNIALINQYCDDLSVVRTKMWTVVQKNNLHQTFSLVRLAHDLGFKTMAFSLNLIDFGLERWREKNKSATVLSDFSHSEACDLMDLGRELGVDVRFWRAAEKYSTRSRDQLCPWPFERAYISSDLRIVPCCLIGDPDVSELGDAHDFAAVWHGPRMRDFRKAHLDGKIPAVCQGCYDDPSPTMAGS